MTNEQFAPWRDDRALNAERERAALRTRVAELEAANRKLHARRFDVCDTLGLLARDENGEILNDPEPEDVIGAIEALQGRAERRAPSVAPAAPAPMSQELADHYRITAEELHLKAPASPATGALSDEKVDDIALHAFGMPASHEFAINRRKEIVRRVLARAATFATAAPAASVEASEVHVKAALAHLNSISTSGMSIDDRVALCKAIEELLLAARSAKGGQSK